MQQTEQDSQSSISQEEVQYELRTPLEVRQGEGQLHGMASMQMEIERLQGMQEEKDSMIRDLQRKLQSGARHPRMENLVRSGSSPSARLNKYSVEESSAEDFQHFPTQPKGNQVIREQRRTIEELREQIQILTSSSEKLRKQCSWMAKFIKKHVEMTESVSGVFREKVISGGWNLKKKAKESWRYTKHVLNYLLDPK